MAKYNITDKKDKEATYRNLVSPMLMDELKEKILSRGFTIDLMKAFSNFTGLAAPDTESLLKARGL